MRKSTRFTVSDPSQIGEIRRSAVSWVQDLGYDETKAGQVAIVVNELGTNILKHAKQGEMILIQNQQGIDILALDKGPGILDVVESMRDGYSTQGTAGNGFGAIKRLSDEFDLYTESGKGTVVYAGFKLPASSESRLSFGGISLPLASETVCGDGWCLKSTHEKNKILVVDGLGHGLLAHAAAQEAIKAFQDSSNVDKLNSLDETMKIHGALRATRGAAIAVGTLDLEKRTLDFCGIGNISAAVVGKTSVKRPISYSGIAGVQVRKVQALTYPFEKDATLILHSDGLDTHWNLADHPGLALKHPLVIAGMLYRGHSRGSDDVTVVVIRERE